MFGKTSNEKPEYRDRPTFLKRFASFFLDILVINIIIIWPFQGLFYEYSGAGISIDALPMNIYLAVLMIFLLSWLYFSFMEYYMGQSIGQMIMGLKVSEEISLWKALVRNCYIIPLFPFYILWISEPLYLAFFKERLLEKVTGTRTMLVKTNNSYEYKLKKV